MVGRFLVFLGGVIVVALFVALLAPLFIDWTDFRKNFEDQASRIIGKKVIGPWCGGCAVCCRFRP